MGMGKDDKPLDEDERPIVCGEAWQRVACKVALEDAKEELVGALGWKQTAVGAPAGAETIVHTLRQSIGRHVGDQNRVLLKWEYENCFNEAEPEAFLGPCLQIHAEVCASGGVVSYGAPQSGLSWQAGDVQLRTARMPDEDADALRDVEGDEGRNRARLC